jgi:hypothetical protein
MSHAHLLRLQPPRKLLIVKLLIIITFRHALFAAVFIVCCCCLASIEVGAIGAAATAATFAKDTKVGAPLTMHLRVCVSKAGLPRGTSSSSSS